MRYLTQSHRDTEDFGVRGSAPILKHRPAFAFFAAKITDLLPLLPFVAKKLLLHFSTSTRLNILNRAEHEERVEKREALHVSIRFNALLPWPQTSTRIGNPITIGL